MDGRRKTDNGQWIADNGIHASLPGFRREGGSSLVEMALILPVILLILLGTLDLGRAVYAQNIITNAAREGARYGAIAPTDTVGIEDRVQSFIVGLDTNSLTITVSADSAKVHVTVTYQFTAVTPLVGSFLGPGGTVTLQGVANMSLEGAQ